MKFSLKVFLSTVSIAAVTFSAGGFYLIDSQFRFSLNQHIKSSYEENYILCQTLLGNKQIRDIAQAYGNINNIEYGMTIDIPLTFDDLKENQIESLRQAAKSITANIFKGSILFRLSNSTYQTIYENIGNLIDNNILKQLPENTKGYEIIFKNEKYYIHTVSPLIVQGETLYIENFRNITSLFEGRKIQYQNFFKIMFCMILTNGILVFLVSKWLTNPLNRLSLATKQIAEGDFEYRIISHSNDEIGSLSKDFNIMAYQLEQMVKELKDAALRQEEFIASFAHELKTPLTSIIGYADMLRSKQMDKEQLVLSANYIFQEGRRLESLSMKLLDLIVLKKQSFKMKQVYTLDFFEDIKSSMVNILDKEMIDLKMDIEDAILFIEPDLMKTVFINLLDNARKAIENGGNISLLGTVSKNEYIVKIKDNGKGIESSELSKITDAFYMIDKSRARAQGGAGLGLAICLEIIKLHNASMSIESIPKVGTCVSVCLKGLKDL